MSTVSRISFSVTWDQFQRRCEAQGKIHSLHRQKGEEADDTVQEKDKKKDVSAEFIVGSSYEGEWDKLGMSGYGTYCFVNGAEYEGEFFDGMFHGNGTIKYPKGQTVKGVWDKGHMVEWSFAYSDGLVSEFGYCRYPDRRFQTSLSLGFQPAGREYLTNEQPTSEIPDKCYDTGDGYYNPDTKCILVKDTGPDKISVSVASVEAIPSDESDICDLKKHKPKKDPNAKDVTIVSQEDEQFILNHCRKAWDESTGYNPELYEHWVSGRRAEVEELERDFRAKYGKKPVVVEKKEQRKSQPTVQTIHEEKVEEDSYTYEEDDESTDEEEEEVTEEGEEEEEERADISILEEEDREKEEEVVEGEEEKTPSA